MVLLWIMLAVAYFNLFRPLHSEVEELHQGNTPSIEARKRFQAKQLFILCSRASNVLDPDKAQSVKLICKNYQTIEQAYETEDAIFTAPGN